MAAKVTNMLVGATDRAKFAAVQGSAWSNNIYYSRNGKNEYMESVPGLKKFAMTATSAVCRGSYVSTIGLRAESSPEDMFAVFGIIGGILALQSIWAHIHMKKTAEKSYCAG